MKRYYVATFVVVLCFMSCGQSQEEKLEFALREVERLDAMRKKVNEILGEQTSDVMLKIEEYEKWKESQRAIISSKEAEIIHAERNLTYWKNWHMIFWERELDKKEARLSWVANDTARYRRILGRTRSEIAQERYTRLLAEKRDSINKIMEEISAHENNRPKFSHKTPQKHGDKISEWENRLFDAKELHRVTVEDMKSIDTAKLQNLDKLRMDLLFTKASYDSINVLHTKAVLELSKK